MYSIYECCSNKPQSKARWSSLEWRKVESVLTHKIIFKSLYVRDYKVIQQEAERAPV